jgi:hypothetical protein
MFYSATQKNQKHNRSILQEVRSILIYNAIAALYFVNISLAYSNDFSFGTDSSGGSEPAEAAILS